MRKIDTTDIIFNKHGAPVMNKEELEIFTQKLIRDFDSTLLKEPKKMDIDRFVEIFLDLDLEYAFLSHNECYLGRTVFSNNEEIIVYIPEQNDIGIITDRENTILLDSRLEDLGREGQRDFTLAHECMHAMLHKDFYTRNHPNQLNMLTNDEVQMVGPFRKKDYYNLVNSKHIQFTTQVDFLEWQANSGASMLIMNRSAMEIFLKSICFKQSNDNFVNSDVINKVSEQFGVSRSSAAVRLKSLGYLNNSFSF